MKFHLHRPSFSRCALLALPALLCACSEKALLPPSADTGAQPTLAAPRRMPLPTVDIAPAVGWRNGQMPQATEGLAVRAFASGLDHPRWLHVLPNGDVLVAETNAPSGLSRRKASRAGR
jgi:glucose/arabinose dehydrogenase